MGTHLHKLGVIYHTALRSILPVYKTTPLSSPYRETALPPFEIALDSRVESVATRLHRLDARHPLARRAKRSKSTPQTRFQRLAARVPPNTEWIDPIAHLPWELNENHNTAIRRVGHQNGLTKDQAAHAFHKWLAGIQLRDIIVYTDGSQQTSNDITPSGASWVITQAGREILRGRHPLGPHMEVFDAKAYAANAGLEVATYLHTAKFADNIHICLDNLEVACRLLSHTAGSSQHIFSTFKRLAELWPLRKRESFTQPGKVSIRWCPGHSNIPGNEIADAEAKAASLQQPDTPLPTSLATTKRRANAYPHIKFQEWWANHAPKRYRMLEITLEKFPRELSLPRFALGKLYAARSGHGNFANYHERFGHEDAELHCICGKLKSPEHFYFCTKGRKACRRSNWRQQKDNRKTTSSLYSVHSQEQSSSPSG